MLSDGFGRRFLGPAGFRGTLADRFGKGVVRAAGGLSGSTPDIGTAIQGSLDPGPAGGILDILKPPAGLVGLLLFKGCRRFRGFAAGGIGFPFRGFLEECLLVFRRFFLPAEFSHGDGPARIGMARSGGNDGILVRAGADMGVQPRRLMLPGGQFLAGDDGGGQFRDFSLDPGAENGEMVLTQAFAIQTLPWLDVTVDDRDPFNRLAADLFHVPDIRPMVDHHPVITVAVIAVAIVILDDRGLVDCDHLGAGQRVPVDGGFAEAAKRDKDEIHVAQTEAKADIDVPVMEVKTAGAGIAGAGRQGSPAAMGIVHAPAYPGGAPDSVGSPDPAKMGMAMPAAIMERRPAPGIIRVPDPAAIRVDPAAAVAIGAPFGIDDADGGAPDPGIVDQDPVSVGGHRFIEEREGDAIGRRNDNGRRRLIIVVHDGRRRRLYQRGHRGRRRHDIDRRHRFDDGSKRSDDRRRHRFDDGSKRSDDRRRHRFDNGGGGLNWRFGGCFSGGLAQVVAMFDHGGDHWLRRSQVIEIEDVVDAQAVRDRRSLDVGQHNRFGDP